ncbi:MAG TPA: exodeoxyribonuclease III, partial [Cyclobacteriaceae bacterium]|nr:exodeoxyribonuclease III [Cyclobacteriaceae bacterium]
MKILTYNINGIRSALSKGFADWLKATRADVVCLQEVKANIDQFDKNILADLGYEIFWMPAVKKGYSGVAILSKAKPNKVNYGCGINKYDDEGRVLRADFDKFSLMSVYMPSGSSGDERQAFKMQWLDDFYGYVQDLKRDYPNLIISGDYNICHKPIDIHNPVSNKNSSGFLPEEREWMNKFVESGFIDAFRHFDDRAHQYTWWSFRAGARKKNLGWRIDYHMASLPMKEFLKKSAILPEAHHSDHCPVLLEL